MSPSTSAGSKLRCRTTCPPPCSPISVVTFRPPMWNSGAAVRLTSPAKFSGPKRAFTLFQKILPCVSIAPLGRPVVPEVYMISATSSASTRSAAASGSTCSVSSSRPVHPGAPDSAPRNCRQQRRSRMPSITVLCASSTTSVCAPASLMMNSSSAPVRRKLSGTKIAPIAVAANSVSRNTGWLWPRKATRSPRLTPCLRSALARWRMRSPKAA